MEIVNRKNAKSRVLKGGYNMYTATISLGLPFKPEADSLRLDEFIGKVARHWSESVDDGLEGMKRAEF